MEGKRQYYPVKIFVHGKRILLSNEDINPSRVGNVQSLLSISPDYAITFLT